MPYKFITVAPDGQIACETHKKLPEWREIQKYVGGPFQIVPYFSSMELDGTKYNRGTAYCNEEGWIKGLQHNLLASAMWMKWGRLDLRLSHGLYALAVRTRVPFGGGEK